MFNLGPTVLCAILFLLAAPLVIQDIQTSSVSAGLLFGLYAIWVIGALFVNNISFLFLSVLVLALGAALMHLFPDRMGEGDLVFMSGMACLLPFWFWILALTLACLGGLAVYLWLVYRRGKKLWEVPIPFFPLLFWGGLTVWGAALCL